MQNSMMSDMMTDVKKDGSFFSTSSDLLPSRLLVEVLKQFSMRKKWCINFLLDLLTDFCGLFEAIFYEKKLVLQFF